MLGFSRALVSRHVTDLEKHLGIRLLTRTTRRITLTEAGAAHLIFASGSFRKLKNKKLLSNGCKRNRPARSRYLRRSLLLPWLWVTRLQALPRRIRISISTSCSTIFRFAVTILSNADSMSQCIRRQFANRAWSPEKLPTCVGCFAHRRIISSSMASRVGREISHGINVWSILTRTQATESGVFATRLASLR